MYPAFQESKRLNENLCCFAVAISIKFQTNNSDSNIVPDNLCTILSF